MNEKKHCAALKDLDDSGIEIRISPDGTRIIMADIWNDEVFFPDDCNNGEQIFMSEELFLYWFKDWKLIGYL